MMTPAELDALPVVFSLETAARALGVGRNQAYDLARRGQFPVRVRVICGRYRVTRYDLMAWLGAPGYPRMFPRLATAQARTLPAVTPTAAPCGRSGTTAAWREQPAEDQPRRRRPHNCGEAAEPNGDE